MKTRAKVELLIVAAAAAAAWWFGPGDEAFARHARKAGLASSEQIEEGRAQAAAKAISLSEALIRNKVITAPQRDSIDGKSLPKGMAGGRMILMASVILLGQGLLRDLWVKYFVPPKSPFATEPAAGASPDGAPPPAAPVKPTGVFCMCMESTVGVIGVIAGLLLLATGFHFYVQMNGLRWGLLVLGVGGFGFIIKDYVLDWRVWKIRREEDHSSVIFW